MLHTGRITQGKGQIDALKASKILHDNDINFVFYFIGDYEDDYEKKLFNNFLSTLEYKNKIKIIGYSNKIGDYLSKADIFLFPSSGEGFGNSFAEALAAGLICISYKNTTFIEFQELGFHFHLSENHNIQDLGNKLLYVTKNFKSEQFNSIKNSHLSSVIFNEHKEIGKYLEILK